MNRMRAWNIRRQLIRRSEAQTRWDQAYQHLLQWTANREGAHEAPLAPQQEASDAHCPLRPRLDQPASPGTNHPCNSLSGCAPTSPAKEKRWMSTTSSATLATAG